MWWKHVININVKSLAHQIGKYFGDTDRCIRKNSCGINEMVSEVTDYLYYNIILTNISIILSEIYEL